MAKAKKLPSGSWRVQVYNGKRPNGKPDYVSITAPTEKEANYLALQHELHYKDVSRNAANMTLDEAMQRYISSKDGVLSPSTIRGYDIIRRTNLQGLMPIRLNKITQQLVQNAINAESKQYKGKGDKLITRSPKTIRNIHGLLTAVLAEYCPTLTLKTTLPQKKLAEQAVLEPEHIAKLIDVVQGNEMEVPVLLALWLCMRSSEITGLTWDCVDFQKNTVSILRAKVRNKDNEWVEKGTKTTASTRVINAPDYIMERLKAAKDLATDDHVVTIRGNCLYQRLKVILQRNGLPNIRFHDLRHTNASVMLLLNIPDKYAQKRGGWSTDYTMKQVYQHTMESKRSAVDEAVDGFFTNLISHEISHAEESKP